MFVNMVNVKKLKAGDWLVYIGPITFTINKNKDKQPTIFQTRKNSYFYLYEKVLDSFFMGYIMDDEAFDETIFPSNKNSIWTKYWRIATDAEMESIIDRFKEQKKKYEQKKVEEMI